MNNYKLLFLSILLCGYIFYTSPTAYAQLGVFDTEIARAKPGDTVATLAIRLNQPPELVAFGAIEAIDFPDKMAQGNTGQLVVRSTRLVEVQGTWGGMELQFREIDAEMPHQFALMPVSPMLAAASYPLELSYMTSSGHPVTRTWYIEVADGNYPSQEILVTENLGALLDPSILGPEIELLDSIWNETTPELYWTTAFSLPLPIGYQLTSPFGIRRSYNGGPYDSFHTGQDYGAPLNTPIIAPADGVVVLAQELEIRGKVVILDHGAGIYTGYWHMRRIEVEVGQKVSVGEQLGMVGSTGLSTGAHLHWEMRIQGVAVAPTQFLEDSIMPTIVQ